MKTYTEIKAQLDEIFDQALKDHSAAYSAGVFQALLTAVLLEVPLKRRQELIAQARSVVKLD